ncbi:MAG TPA: hypothetical protein VEP90_02070, partial [Methylomirabilota bacterium]|nr:hypothetical protein [Methylomirabilota bacterium]
AVYIRREKRRGYLQNIGSGEWCFFSPSVIAKKVSLQGQDPPMVRNEHRACEICETEGTTEP